MPVPIGSDINQIGQLRPGTYLAERDVNTLPKVKDLAKEKWASFSGNMYALAKDGKTKAEKLIFVQGKKREFNAETKSVTYTNSFSEVVKAYTDSYELYIGTPETVSFVAKLPEDSRKLTGFYGTLTFSAKKMKSEEALRLTLKKGKVTGRMP